MATYDDDGDDDDEGRNISGSASKISFDRFAKHVGTKKKGNRKSHMYTTKAIRTD